MSKDRGKRILKIVLAFLTAHIVSMVAYSFADTRLASFITAEAMAMLVVYTVTLYDQAI